MVQKTDLRLENQRSVVCFFNRISSTFIFFPQLY